MVKKLFTLFLSILVFSNSINAGQCKIECDPCPGTVVVINGQCNCWGSAGPVQCGL